MSIWECPRCYENGRLSVHLYGQTECKRCGYKRGSNARYNKIEREEARLVDLDRRSLASLFYD